MASSHYLKLKLLVESSDSSSSSSPSPPSPSPSSSSSSLSSHLVKKLEVARTIEWNKLKRILDNIAGVNGNETTQLQVLRSSRTKLDELVTGVNEEWLTIQSGQDWLGFINGQDKLTIQLVKRPSACYNARQHVRPVIPPKAPGPWPKYNPQPHELPTILLSHDEHEWEIVEDDEFETGELVSKSEQGKSSKKNLANGKVTILNKVNKPKRVLPAELIARLTGGSNMNAPPSTNSSVTLAVNGSTYVIENPSPVVKLIEYLRYELGITGSKIGCGEGGCGACTVVLSRKDPTSGQLIQFSSKACLIPIAGLDGFAVTTVEGMGSQHSGLHPIQQAIVDKWATQCGGCTPGFVSTMYGLLLNNPNPTLQQIEDHFDGNLCRCTGYRPIFAAMRSVVPGLEEEKKGNNAGCGSACGCSKNGNAGCGSSSSTLHPCGKGDGASCSSSAKSACHSHGITCGVRSGDMEDMCSSSKYDPTNPLHNIDPFTPELAEYNATRLTSGSGNSIRWSSDETCIWIEPQSLDDISNMLSYYHAQNEVVKLLVGNTSIGVEKYFPLNANADHPTVFVHMNNVASLKTISTNANGMDVGAAVTIGNLILALDSAISSNPSTTASWVPISRHLKMVANVAVRNVGSWAGNLMLCHNHPEFPSDLMTIFAGIGANVVLYSVINGTRQVNVVDLPSIAFGTDEFIQSLHIPTTPPGMVFDSYKIRSRHQNAHPIINAGYHFFIQSSQANATPTIQSSNLIVGGLTTGIFRCQQTMAYLAGKPLNADTLAGALAQLDVECVPGTRVDPNSTYFLTSPSYRHSLVLATFYKFFIEQMAAQGLPVPSRDQSAFEVYKRPISSGTEVFTPDASEAPVGQPIPKIESAMQTTGEAKYIDDLTLPPNGLWASFVYSTIALGSIESIDTSPALSLPGVVQFISAADIAKLKGGVNDCGSFPGDEEVFATKDITTCGQSIGLILADTRAHAEVGAAAVVVKYTMPPTGTKPVVTIMDAIAKQSFFQANQYQSPPVPISCGNFDQAYAAAPNRLKGSNSSLGQTHFFMETQTCMAVPSENDSLYVHSSSQGPVDIRAAVMRATSLPGHKVTVSTRRAGGGFGGKLSRSHPIAVACALAARITNRPIKAQCSRTTDMDMFGGRHAFYMEYRVGFDNNGKILALDVDFYQHGGHTYEANFGCMSMCLLWADNAYYVPNYTVSGFSCKTNTPSNTAMRSPGVFNSVWQMEYMMELIANQLGLEPDTVRANNFYTEGQLTPYQQPVTNITIQRVWSELQTQSNYSQVKTDVANFNAANKWRKQGVHMTAVKYGITDPGNAVSILLNISSDDGTIVVSHTGVELGQGINTKVAQTIAYQLGIDMSLIIVDDNVTNVLANGGQTGGSSTSESACAAALNACAELNQRLAPIKTAHPGATWPALIAAATASQVNLTVASQYNLPSPSMPFTYFVWAAACSRVELDVLTGEVQILKTDLVYDCGNSLNPAVDIGQIEGAFIMGIGHYLTEHVVYDSDSGRLLTRGTWDYHPPASQDIPLELNVTLLSSTPNTAPGSILGSKATAEPPMMLSSSVFFAVRDCIKAVRADQGMTDWFDLPAPASTEVIQQACGIRPNVLTL